MTSDTRVRWEYWVETHCTSEDADRLGADGWELVTIVEGVRHGERSLEGWFKRPIVLSDLIPE
jgi:hypothetical protein